MAGATFFTILTTLGKAKLANALALGRQINLTEMAVGDGGGYPVNPTESMTELTHEVYRRQINSLATDPDNDALVLVSFVIPVDEGGWYIREAGIYDEDGDLFAVGNLPETYKPVLDEGVGTDFNVRLMLEVQNAESVILKIDPGLVLATRQWTIDQIALAVKGHDGSGSAHKDIRAAIADLQARALSRTPLTSGTTFYVRADGDDSSLWPDTPETALASLEAVVPLLDRIDPRGHAVIIDVGPGTFTTPVTIAPGHDVLYIQGAGVGVTYLAGALQLQGNITGVTCLGELHAFEQCFVRGVDSPGHIQMRGCGVASYSGGNMQLGGATVEYEPDPANPSDPFGGMLALNGGVIRCLDNTRLVANDTPEFSVFAQAGRDGAIILHRCTFSGAATGQKFAVSENGRISGLGANASLNTLFGDKPGQWAGNGYIGANGVARLVGRIHKHTGAVSSGVNIASVTVTGPGQYTIVPTIDLPGTGVAVVFGMLGTPDTSSYEVDLIDIAPTYIKVATKINGALTNAFFSIACFW